MLTTTVPRTSSAGPMVRWVFISKNSSPKIPLIRLSTIQMWQTVGVALLQSNSQSCNKLVVYSVYNYKLLDINDTCLNYVCLISVWYLTTLKRRRDMEYNQCSPTVFFPVSIYPSVCSGNTSVLLKNSPDVVVCSFTQSQLHFILIFSLWFSELYPNNVTDHCQCSASK